MFVNAQYVVSQDLCRAVSALGPIAERVLDRCTSERPKALDMAGTLVEAVKSQADREAGRSLYVESGWVRE